MNTVTGIINQAHLSNNSTLGQPVDLPLYGWPLVPSINLSTAYAFNSIEELGAYHENKYDSVRYTRDSSLLVRQIENYFMLLHDNSKALLFNSGMSALSACFNVCINSKTKILTFGEFYRKCVSIFNDLEQKHGVKHINYKNYEQMINECQYQNDIIILVESPSNPFLRIADLKAIRNSFKDAIIIFDNTFQGLLNSIDQFKYSDFIVMSCTKYIGGHNDIFAGAVASPSENLYAKLWDERSMRGGIIDNFTAYLLLRSLRTYDLRVEKSLENVEKVLNFLEHHNSIKEIFYPGRYANQDQEPLFTATHHHGGAVVTFRVSPEIPLENNLTKLCSTKMAPSFGSVDSLIEIPMYMSHWGKPKEELLKLGLDDRTVRFSIGNEPINYILDDLQRLLSG